MSRLKIKGIPIEDDLLLDWDIGFCSNDPAYLKYGKFEELILSTDPKNEYVTYEELYEVLKRANINRDTIVSALCHDFPFSGHPTKHTYYTLLYTCLMPS